MRIKELREEKGLTQAELAKAIGTSIRNIGRWENGKNEPLYSQLVKLANFFECSIDFLVEQTEYDLGNIKSINNDEQLSKEEKRLLAFFRGMNEVYKNAVLTTAENLYNLTTKSGGIVKHKN